MAEKKNDILKQLADTDYKSLLEELCKNIKGTRISVARRINEGILHLYWNIGKSISERKISEGYGSAVIKRLSVDLKKEFPNMGLSERNLWNMLSFYNTFSVADQKLQQLVAVLPWGHILLLMNKLDSLDAMRYYAEQAVSLGWTRNVLLNYIKAKC